MYRIVIVDDFHIEREMAKAIIEESKLSLDICGEYAGAKDALAHLSEDKPDIMLVDIEMPGMSGIELAKVVKEEQPSIRIVFFSYHHKFDYVKEAIDLSAYGYILKPIDENEIITVISKVINEIQEDEKHKKTDQDYRRLLNEARPMMARAFLLDIFFGRLGQDIQKILERAEYLGISTGKGPYVLCYLQLVVMSENAGSTVEERELSALKASTLMEEVVEEVKEFIFCRVGEFEWAFLLSGQRDSLITDMIDYITVIMDKIKHIKLNSFAAISRPFDNLSTVGRILKQTEHLISFRFNMENGYIVLQDEISGSDLPEDEYEVILNKAVHACISTSPEETREAVSELIKAWTPNIHPQLIRNTCYRILAELQQLLSEYNITFSEVFRDDKMPWKKLTAIESVKDIRKWIENVMVFISEYVNEKKDSAGWGIVEDIRKYITQHYSTGLTVKDIANQFSYNPNYLNNLYKNVAGETILDFITRYRIDEARRLLRSTNMRIADICYSVGYGQEAYFKSLFKRYAGMSPKEYRTLSGGSRNEDID